MDELIQRAKNGEGEAISELYQAHKEAVFRFISFRVGTQEDCEDLFQEVMLAAFDSLARFRGEVPFLHWCYQIARNKIAYFWREKQKRPLSALEEDIPLIEAEDSEENPYDEERIKNQVLQVLDSLPENYRQILEYRFLHQKTLKESAELMQTSLANAKVLQHRALKKAAEIGLKPV